MSRKLGFSATLSYAQSASFCLSHMHARCALFPFTVPANRKQIAPVRSPRKCARRRQASKSFSQSIPCNCAWQQQARLPSRSCAAADSYHGRGEAQVSELPHPRASISHHPKHDFKGIISRNPTNISMRYYCTVYVVLKQMSS